MGTGLSSRGGDSQNDLRGDNIFGSRGGGGYFGSREGVFFRKKITFLFHF